MCDGFGSPIWFDGFWFGVMGLLGFGSARLVCGGFRSGLLGWWVLVAVCVVSFFFFFNFNFGGWG